MGYRVRMCVACTRDGARAVCDEGTNCHDLMDAWISGLNRRRRRHRPPFTWCQLLAWCALVLEAGRCGYSMAWATASLGRPADGLDHIDATVRTLVGLP